MEKRGNGLGEWPLPKGKSLLPRGKGVSLSRTIELDFDSAEKDQFKRRSMKQHYIVSNHYLTNQSKVWSHFMCVGY